MKPPGKITPTEEAVRWRAEHRFSQPPKVLRDAELRAFVDAHIESMTFEALAQACLERFGPERAPRMTALWLYFRKYYRRGV